MLLYVLKRVGLALVTLVLLSLVIFFAAQVLPGNPGRAILGPFASQHSVGILDHELGVDRPVIVQYWSWVSGIVQGRFGTSYQYQAPDSLRSGSKHWLLRMPCSSGQTPVMSVVWLG